MRTIAPALLFLLLSLPLCAQRKNEKYQYHIHKTSHPVRIDGVGDDLAWSEAEVAKDFYMVTPMDTSYAKVKTEVLMSYDDEYLYLLAVCYNSSLPGPYMVESLRRDFAFPKNDNFLLFMDPFDDQTNGFSFGANAAGAQWDGTMYSGGLVDLNWDNKWLSEVKWYDDRYLFEAAIPFKTIRYKKGITRWGINFSRNDLKTTEKSSWAPMPRQFPTASLAYTGLLIWDQPPPVVGPNVSIIPFALGRITRDYENHEANAYKGAVGGDAKIAVTSSLNLDLTVNPDFSQVDVDQQVTNLDRFELFFPEKRQFFLENGDLFANFGFFSGTVKDPLTGNVASSIRPFFSRRIGLDVPIQFGARLSGRIDRNWRIGMMDMQTKAVSERGLPLQNFGVMAIQRRVFTRSNISFMLINKESLNYQPSADPKIPVYTPYNRNVGLEYNLASVNNQWTGKSLFMKSFSPDKKGADFVQASNLQYSSRIWTISWQHEWVGKNYTAEVGYVPRRGYFRLNPLITRLYFPKSKKILSHGPGLTSSLYFNNSLQTTDNETIGSYLITFRSQSKLNVWASHTYIKLLAPFDPTNSGLDSLAAGTEHYFDSYGFDFTSKPQSRFTYLASLRNGGYYGHGTRLNLLGQLGYRFQPYVSITLYSSYNLIRLPETSGRTTFWLIGPRVDVTLTNKVFITAFAQYNDQRKNVNLNARFQWRYRPASDLFLVYTDNYLPENFSVKNRALVLKFTYWWSI